MSERTSQFGFASAQTLRGRLPDHEVAAIVLQCDQNRHQAAVRFEGACSNEMVGQEFLHAAFGPVTKFAD